MPARRPARVSPPPTLQVPGQHVPVLLDEVLDWLQPHAGGRYVDARLGNGGHSAAILERSEPNGRLLGLDADPDAIIVARERLAPYGERATLVNANFHEPGASVVEARQFGQVDGILMDLGLSSRQLDAGGRGFTFRREEPLDMRFDPTRGEWGADLLNHADEEEIADILYQYGEEYRSRRVARAIVRQRETVRHRNERATWCRPSNPRPSSPCCTTRISAVDTVRPTRSTSTRTSTGPAGAADRKCAPQVSRSGWPQRWRVRMPPPTPRAPSAPHR